jgi:hypothetical protein
MSHNRNPKGKNQYNSIRMCLLAISSLQSSHQHIADADDPNFVKKLTDLFREGLGDKAISL